jgi:radical SAM protein
MIQRTEHTNNSPRFSNKPVLVFWETTKACPLACKHCRASAIHDPLPGELNTQEGYALIDSVTEFGTPAPVLILTGGDPMARSDIFELMHHARNKGVKFAVSPAVSPSLDSEKLTRLRDVGATSISVSLDGACSETHDRIRNIAGTFDNTMRVIREANAIGLAIQVNTTVMKSNMREMAKIFHLIKSMGVKTWEVFFLIKIGRGSEVEEITPQESESVCNFLYDSSMCGMTVRTVEAPFIRRVASMRRSAGMYCGDIYLGLRNELSALGYSANEPSSIASIGTLDGDGILFIANDGSIYPGGFLPLKLGDSRSNNIVEVYRDNEMLKGIRDRSINGPCGTCRYKQACGGSRARSFVSSSNPLGSDTACAYAYNDLHALYKRQCDDK